jgi:Tfp pilus assembly protein PilO
MTLGNNLTTWNILCGLAMVVMVGAACFELAVPKPNSTKEWRKLDGQRKILIVKQRNTENDLEKARKQMASFVRKGGSEQAAPVVLDDLNTVAKATGVKLANFRPGRTTASGDLTMVPFDVTATGSFNQLVDFMRRTEEPSHLLAVNSLQINNSEGAGDQVTATISFVTLNQTPKPVVPAPSKSVAPTSKPTVKNG